MARTKKTTGVTSGNHLTVTHCEDGTVDLKWNWDALLEEVRAAAGIVAVTEAKVKKTRAKKVSQ